MWAWMWKHRKRIRELQTRTDDAVAKSHKITEETRRRYHMDERVATRAEELSNQNQIAGIIYDSLIRGHRPREES